MPTTTKPIDSTTSVNELLGRYPAALPVLHALGVDSCCGGATSLTTAAEGAGITVDTLLAKVTTAVEEAFTKDDCCQCGGNCSATD